MTDCRPAVRLADGGKATEPLQGPGAALGEAVGAVAEYLRGDLAQPQGLLADELAVGLVGQRPLAGQRETGTGEAVPVAQLAHLAVVDEALVADPLPQHRRLGGGGVGAEADTGEHWAVVFLWG